MKSLAKLRKGKNLTQKELAEIIGISASSIAMYETGERQPSLEKAKILADFFGVTIEEIFFNKNAHDKKAKNNKQSA